MTETCAGRNQRKSRLQRRPRTAKDKKLIIRSIFKKKKKKT